MPPVPPTLTPTQVDEFVASVYPATPKLGFSCGAIGRDFAEARWRFDPDTLRPGGFISGPTQFTTCDLALWYLSFTVLGLAEMAVTADLHITFLRPGKGGDLLARAELVRAGKSRIYGRVSAWVEGDSDRPVAHAVGSYALLARS